MSSIPSVSYQGANPGLNLIQQKAVSKPDEVKNESQQVAFQGAESSKEMSKGAKIALAGLGALGTIGLAIYAIKKGKAPKDIVKELSIDDFRQAGNKLVKGKAYKPDGSAFSGVFTSMKKDGSKVVMTYENGILKSSEILKPLKGKFIPSSKKVYEHGADGKISKISKKIWGHVNTPDPKTHGFQWIEKDVVDMNKVREKNSKIIEFMNLDSTVKKMATTSDGKILLKTADGVVKYEIMPNGALRELNTDGNVIKELVHGTSGNVLKYDASGEIVSHFGYVEKELQPFYGASYGTVGKGVRQACKVSPCGTQLTNSYSIRSLKTDKCYGHVDVRKNLVDKTKTIGIDLPGMSSPSLEYKVGSGMATILDGNGRSIATYNRKTKQIDLLEGCTQSKEEVQEIVDKLLKIGNDVREQWKYAQGKSNAEYLEFQKLADLAFKIQK